MTVINLVTAAAPAIRRPVVTKSVRHQDFRLGVVETLSKVLVSSGKLFLLHMKITEFMIHQRVSTTSCNH